MFRKRALIVLGFIAFLILINYIYIPTIIDKRRNEHHLEELRELHAGFSQQMMEIRELVKSSLKRDMKAGTETIVEGEDQETKADEPDNLPPPFVREGYFDLSRDLLEFDDMPEPLQAYEGFPINFSEPFFGFDLKELVGSINPRTAPFIRRPSNLFGKKIEGFYGTIGEYVDPSRGQQNCDILHSHSKQKCDCPCEFQSKLPNPSEKTMEAPPPCPMNKDRDSRDIVMTTCLDSDVPVQYWSWEINRILEPAQEKTAQRLGAAFISNCGGSSGRLQILRGLMENGFTVDSYGNCEHNADGAAGQDFKVRALTQHYYSLAFENTIKDDYVTEKYFQSLVAGTIPLYLGADNIMSFSPWPGYPINVLAWRKNISGFAHFLQDLAANTKQYHSLLVWKRMGPTDDYMALMDLGNVHSDCRLCILAADRDKREWYGPKKELYYIRERGTFYHRYFYPTSPTIRGLFEGILAAFEPNYETTYDGVRNRPVTRIRRIHSVFPSGSTVKASLFGKKVAIKTDDQVRQWMRSHEKLDVIFI